MASLRPSKVLSDLKRRGCAIAELKKRAEQRRLRMELLEDRRLMALGPSLVSVLPNTGPLLSVTINPSATLAFNNAFNEAPRDISFRFAQGTDIDPSSLANGFKVMSGGSDHILGDGDDQTITPGFLGLGDSSREVIMRFAATLPDNAYSITLVGSGLTPLKDTGGNPFNSGSATNPDLKINLSVDLGAKVDAVVPQPITRGTNNVLQQSSNTIDVYFDQQMLTTDVVKPGFYRLIDATSGAITLPASITYSEDETLKFNLPQGTTSGTALLSYNGVSASLPLAVGATTTAAAVQANLNTIAPLNGKVAVTGSAGGPFTVKFTGALAGTNVKTILSSNSNVLVSQQPKATLNFTNAIAAGTWKLEVGTTSEPDDRLTTSQHIGNSMTTSLAAFIGDNLSLSGAAQANDVDLYRLDVQNAVNDLSVTVKPAAGSTLDAAIRIFDSNGNQLQLINGNGAGLPETASNITLSAGGVYYIGVSSAGNVAYNPNNDSGAAGGTTTGAYSIQATFTDQPTGLQTLSIVSNSTTGTSADTVLLSYNGVAALNGISVEKGPAGTQAAVIQGALSSIPALAAFNVTVSGPDGGPYNITFPAAPVGTVFAPIVSSSPSVAITTIDDRFLGAGNSSNIDNSSFDTASNVGVIGSTGRTIAGAILPTPDPSQMYNINYPGSGDAPGDRQVPYLGGAYLQTPIGQSPDPTAGVETITYDFQNFYGYTPQGAPLQNAITENQKQRVREIFELFARTTGMQFREVDPLEDGSVQAEITIVTGDIRATGFQNSGFSVTTGFPQIPVSQQGNPDNALLTHEFVVVNADRNWGNSEYGGQWFLNAIDGIDGATGLQQHQDLPDLSAQKQTGATEPFFPSNADVLIQQALHRPESNDIDLYKFAVSDTSGGLFRAETIAERLANSTPDDPNLLNTVLTLYKETLDSSGNKIRTEIARDDDYYGNDSYLELHLDPGTYYVAVTSTGNTQFDPTILDTGSGGRTQGAYQLSMSLKPDAMSVSMNDATGVAFDGDGDGHAGGTYQFWFQSNTAANTIYVDKASTASGTPDGTLAKPYKLLKDALAAAGNSATKKIVRIVGNGGTDGNIATYGDDQPYLVGYKDSNLLQPLADGGDFLVPKNVTVMIDAGTVIKMRKANLNAGTTSQGVVSKAGGSIQVLGTPQTPVQITSYSDDTIGGDSNPTEGPGIVPQGGDFGGIVFRDDSDHEADFLAGLNPTANPLNLAMPVFLNYVNHASINYGGGKVTVDSVQNVYDAIYLDNARATVSYNTVQASADAAMSANPNSFDDDGLNPTISFDNRRIGPDIHDNTLLNNSINGLFVRIRTDAGTPLDVVDLTTRWKSTDIVYVVSENLVISGTPGGSIFPGLASSTAGQAPETTRLEDGRLRIDPGVTVKMSGARIETKISSQLIAEGNTELPIIFTSIKDDRYGAGGTFDTNKDGQQSAGNPGQWGGFYLGPASTASMDHVGIFYGGGSVPIEGGFSSFNAVESNQADLRLTNSVLQFNDGGGAAANDIRNGRGTNSDAVIFIRGAQPILVNNIIRDNNLDALGTFNATGPAVSINANSMVSTVQGDYGRITSTPAGDPTTPFRFAMYDDNHGPLVRGNRLTNNTLNGMEVRGETLTTESIWDDTDIAHILQSEIRADNLHVYGGLRIESSPSDSLVVKLFGANAGFTASGTPLDISDRVGGTVQVIGQPGHPVVLTSLFDDTVSAGFDPNGLPEFDTNNDGSPQTFLGTPPTFPAANGPFQVTYNTNASQLASAIELRQLPQGVTVTNAAYTGSSISAGTYVNGDAVPLGIAPHGIILSSGDAQIPASNTTTSFTGTNQQQPGDTDLTTLAGAQTFDAAVLTITINVAAGSNIRSGAFDFQFGSDEYPEFVGSPFNDVFGTMINGGAATNVAHDSRGNLVNINSAFFTQNNTNGNLKIEYDGLTAGLTATFPLHVGDNVLKIAIADASDPVLDSGVLLSDLRFSTRDVGAGGVVRLPTSGDWRSINLDENSNDTNVSEVLETEPAYVGVDGAKDNNRAPQQAQVLGALAPNDKSGDDTRRLGYQVDGTIAMDNPSDVDVYSFTADSGTEVWFDLARTSPGLDGMLELVDADGNVIASATDTDPTNPVVTPVAPPTVTEVTHGSLGTNEVQRVTLSTPSTATSYVFTLNYQATPAAPIQKTGPISSSATSADVLAALLAIPGSPFVAGDLAVTGSAAIGWTITFQGNFAGLPVALLTSSGGTASSPNNIPGLNVNVPVGQIGLAQSFDKDAANGRHFYATNGGPTVGVASGSIVSVDPASVQINGTFPLIITSPNHGLKSGDRVQISGVTGFPGIPDANGVYTVTVTDSDHFALVGTAFSFGLYTPNTGTWTKLVETSRDPIMRVVLPNAANGTALKNSPWFIRVRSQPTTFSGEAGNTLNPGLTSGQYQLQVRLQQTTEKPASTVRFADIRFATNGIEIHGLPYHSPLAGETAEAATANGSTANDTQSGAQFIGNVLTTDHNTITVGGQIANINDVDWYQFDLNADQQTIYGSGFNTFAAIFDMDYADGLARPDTTISVFDQNGTLIYIGRNSNNTSDVPAAGQGTSASDLNRGSFGQLDPFIGSVQLPAGKIATGRTRTYYVAVSTDRSIPTTLNQQFLSQPTDSLVRVEPIDSIGRIVQDTLDGARGQTAQLAQNQYEVVQSTAQTQSTFFNTGNKQTLAANVVPFNLSDVSMFVSERRPGTNTTNLLLANPGTGVVDISRIGTLDTGNLSVDDLTMRGDGTLWAYESDFTPGNSGTSRSHAGIVNQVDPSTAIMTALGPDNVPITPATPVTPPTIQSVQNLNSGRASAIAWGGNSISPNANSTDEPLYVAIDDFDTGVSALYFANFANGNANFVQNQPWGRIFGPSLGQPLDLTNASRASTSTNFGIPGLLVTVQDTAFGSSGNNRHINFTEDPTLTAGAPPVVQADQAVQNDVDVTLNPVGAPATLTKTLVNGDDLTATATSVGTGGNSIVIQFTAQSTVPPGAPNTGPIPPSISVSGKTISITLSSVPGRHTTIDQVVDILNDTQLSPVNPPPPNNPASAAAAALVSASSVTFGQGKDALGFATQPGYSPFQLTQGKDPTTVQDLVNALNASGLNLLATFSPPAQGTTIIGDEISELSKPIPPGPRGPYTPGTPPITQLTLGGGTGQTGFTTGLAFGPDANTLYGVSDQGQFFKVDIDPSRNPSFNNSRNAKDGQGNPALIFPPTQVVIPDLNNAPLSSPGGSPGVPSFSGLARGPLDLNNGEFANDFFATTSDGILVCLDSSGNPQQVFDRNGDGVVDSYSVQMRILGNGGRLLDGVTGLAFSNLDFNLWHPTDTRGGDPGHQPALTAATPDLNSDRTNVPANANTSFYFGFENTGNGAALGPYGQLPPQGQGVTSTVNGTVSNFSTTGVVTNNTLISTVQDPNSTNTTTVFTADPNDPGLSPNSAAYNGLFLTFDASSSVGVQSRQILNYIVDPNTGDKTFVLSSPLPGIPQSSDIFTIQLSTPIQFNTDLTPQSPGFSYAGLALRFTSGQNAGQSQVIQSYNAATGQVVMTSAFGSAPNDGDQFSVQNLVPGTQSRFDANAGTLSSQDDFYDGDTLTFTAGANANVTRTILRYIAATHTFQFTLPFPNIPGNNDAFTITHTTPTKPEQLADGGQYGILARNTIYTGTTGKPGAVSLPANRTAAELANNPNILNTYNMPGGAQGKLESGKFSLVGVSAQDLPTFYFDYFLDVEDANSTLQNHNMVDSARVFIGPFTRIDPSAPLSASGSVSSSPNTTTQFSGFNSLSNVDGFYNGQALTFTTGVLTGQSRVVANYIGATRTFVFTNGFTAAPNRLDSFQIGAAITTWDLLATNNSHLDNPATGVIDGELPTFLSQQASEFPDNPRQQVQELFNNTGGWRQARVDLSRYVGMDNLQLRFDFSTAGTTTRNLSPSGAALPFEDAYYPTNPGSMSSTGRLQDNQHQGFFVDNFVVGLAGRGEMVTNAQSDPTMTSAPARQNWVPGFPPPAEVQSGAYQLEIRRGTDYATSNSPTVECNKLVSTLDLHQQELSDLRLTTPSTPTINDGFESGTFFGNTRIQWSSGSNLALLPTPSAATVSTPRAPWTIVNAPTNSGSFAAASGVIGDNQQSYLQTTITTGAGIVSFAASVQSDPGDLFRFYVDGELATDTNGLITEYTGNVPFQTINVLVSAGSHTFRWAFEKDANPGSPGQAFLDDVSFPTPSVGVQNVYTDPNTYHVTDGQTFPSDTLLSDLHVAGASFLTPQLLFASAPNGMQTVGDQNLHRVQGHIQIEQNAIDSAKNVGILVDPGTRDASTNNPYSAVRNLPTLSTDRLVPGVTLTNNVVSNFGVAGISVSGDANANVNGQQVPLAAVPFARIDNNTVYGGLGVVGTGIRIGVNAGPTLINNVIANTATGVAIDPTSTATTVVGANLYAGNTSNGVVGTNSINVPAGTPIFRNPAALNFYPIAGGLVTNVSVTNGGSGYTSVPTVVFSGGGGTGAAGVAVLGPPVVTNSVSTITVTNGGTGYTSAPTVNFTGGGGSGAIAVANVSAGVITSISIISGGSGYTSVPTITFTGGGGSGAAATAAITPTSTDHVTNVTVTSGGTGYISAPLVTFTGGGGTGATGFATISSGAVVSVTITNAGSGYTSAPTISFSGGGGSGAAATASLLDMSSSVVSVTITSAGSGYTSGPVITFIGGGGSGATATAGISTSPAVDSSLNSLADRPSISAVKSSVGIPQSPILAPEVDQFGQLRVDDPSVSPPPGLGQNIFKDRGAVERADFSRPTAGVYVTDGQLVDIFDNDAAKRDRNAADDDMAIRNTDVTRFVIRLDDVGVGIDDATVTSSQFIVTATDLQGVTRQLFDAGTQPLGTNPDYTFVYNAKTHEAIFIPTFGVWPQNNTYTITLNNTAEGSVDALNNPLPAGILDLAGNPILSNRVSGQTTFNIFVGILYDFGDAPDPVTPAGGGTPVQGNYPTLLADNGAAHLVVDGFHLGATITEEPDGKQTSSADGDKNPDGTTSDDGVSFANGTSIQGGNISLGFANTIKVSAAIPAGMTGHLDAWIDVNRDGKWTADEKIVFDGNPTGTLVDGVNTLTFTLGTKQSPHGVSFARFRFSSAGISVPTGIAPDGEVEDYQINDVGSPYQNFSNAFDVNNDGKISPSDALTIINYINAFGPGALVLGQPPIPDPAPNKYVDVDGDTFISPNDVLQVINYLNAHPTTGGEGEGESASLAQSSATQSSATQPSTIIPAVLIASPDVVIETRDRASTPAATATQSLVTANRTAQDAALMALASSNSDSADALDPKLASSDSSLDEESWEDLLGALASDQEHQS